MRNVVKGIAFLCLLFSAAGVFAAPKNPDMGLMHSDPGDDGGGGVLWVAENSYGDGLFRQLGSDESIRETFSYVSDIGETIDVKIDYETSEWSVTDAIDTLSFHRTGSGWVMERSKKGFYGLTWFTGPVGGIAATPVYILAVKATNDWVLGQCGH